MIITNFINFIYEIFMYIFRFIGLLICSKVVLMVGHGGNHNQKCDNRTGLAGMD